LAYFLFQNKLYRNQQDNSFIIRVSKIKSLWINANGIYLRLSELLEAFNRAVLKRLIVAMAVMHTSKR